MSRRVVHLDLDMFFVDCELKEDSSLKGKPVIIGCNGDRGVVSSCSYEARAFGTFLDEEGNFFDTVHFPKVFAAYLFSGGGVYLILGKVVEEFGFPSIDAYRMAKLTIISDPRGS